MQYFLKKFFSQSKDMFITEFGHSAYKTVKKVGPWSRDMYILHFIVKGSCEFSGFDAKEGQAFLISKGGRHSFAVIPDYEHYWIGFDGEKVKDLFEMLQLEHQSHQLFFIKDFDFAQKLLDATFQKIGQNGAEDSEPIALSSLMALLPLLTKQEHCDMPKANYADKVQKMIQINYVHPITMAEIAKEIHISEKYMYRLFVQQFGTSPQKYLLKTRMEAASALLTETKLTVQEVARSVGYSSFPSFSKAFSNYFKVSPSLFKKREIPSY